MTRSISHVRVLDVSRTFAWSSWLGQILTDLGAEVIKVEKPGLNSGESGLDSSSTASNSQSESYIVRHPNNKSITVDFDKPEGKEIIKALINKSTVFIADFGNHEESNTDFCYEHIKQTNPSIIYCLIDSMTPQAFNTTDEQTKIITSMYVSAAALSAIAERERLGTGQLIDMRQLDEEVASLSQDNSEHLLQGAADINHTNIHPHLVPYQTFATDDGYIFIAISQDEIFDRFCRVLGLESIAMDKRFADNSSRVLHKYLLTHIISERLGEHTTEFWLELFDQSGISCGPVNSPYMTSDVQNHSQMDLFSAPIHADNKERKQRTRPTLGEHTTSVLQDLLGLDVYKMLELRKAAVI